MKNSYRFVEDVRPNRPIKIEGHSLNAIQIVIDYLLNYDTIILDGSSITQFIRRMLGMIESGLLSDDVIPHIFITCTTGYRDQLSALLEQAKNVSEQVGSPAQTFINAISFQVEDINVLLAEIVVDIPNNETLLPTDQSPVIGSEFAQALDEIEGYSGDDRV